MLARAAAEGGPDTAAYVRAGAVRLPLEDSTVDGVCCFAARHMFAEPETALDSFARTVRRRLAGRGGPARLTTANCRRWRLPSHP